MTRCAILQSNYIPWKGYFDLIAYVDIFVLFDSVQYTRADWRNRNKIKTAQGTRWLTVPVAKRPRWTPINEMVIYDADWRMQHLQILRHSYRTAECFSESWSTVEKIFESAKSENLSEMNESLLRSICDVLGIKTKILRDTDFELSSERQSRLISICKQAGADTYVSGPAARNYIEQSKFEVEHLNLEWFDYEGYGEYKQVHPPFEHQVSIVDLLLNQGKQARNYLRYTDKEDVETQISA